jgi:hypothetical protein
MGNTPSSHKPAPTNRYSVQKSVPNMATPRQPQQKKKGGAGGFILTLLILAGAVWLLMLIFGWGPYKPGEEDVTPTASGTIAVSVNTTATPIQNPGATITAAPGSTATATVTPTREVFPYQLSGDPEAFSSDLLRPGLGCDWLVIAGQVWDLTGEEVPGMTLHLYGEIGGYAIDQTTVSGRAKVYGESGYEFALESVVVDSDGTLFIQLLDSDGSALSMPYAIETFADCQKNLILTNFKQVR